MAKAKKYHWYARTLTWSLIGTGLIGVVLLTGWIIKLLDTHYYIFWALLKVLGR